ncbi:MAG TPA: MlaD family protein [Solirubrobacteraceae bacterium]|nr:MlaD family protein [Solirubrobacteraceae bacterium]
MQKQAPTLGRMLLMVGFALSCFGLLLFLWLAFGGSIPLKPKQYRFQVAFPSATQLAVEADVRISGVPVGRVKSVEADKTSGRSNAVIELKEQYAPLPRDVRAILRQKTLLGETYVELTPGTTNGPKLPEGGTLASAQVSETVELDEIFRAFDPKTREAFQVWMQQQSRSLNGRAQDINDALGNLDPFAEETTELLRVLDTQDGALRQLVSNTGVVFDALSERQGQLQGLIRNANDVFSTTAERDQELRELFTVFPTFNREAEQTVRRLSRTARISDPVITQLRPAARELSPTFQEIDELAPDLNQLIENLDPLIDASERGLPALRRFLDDLPPALGDFEPTLKQLNPLLSYLSSHRNELRGFLANVPAATQARQEGIHYLRTANPLLPENVATYPRRLGSNRSNPYMKPNGYLDLAEGQLKSYETRQCGRGNPSPGTAEELAGRIGTAFPYVVNPLPQTNPLAPPIPTTLQLSQNILTYVFANADRNTPAPKCVDQGPYTVNEGVIGAEGGESSRYPHVRQSASGTRVPAAPSK